MPRIASLGLFHQADVTRQADMTHQAGATSPRAQKPFTHHPSNKVGG
ncbi:hypothetical protein JOE56_000916 [Brevibacterium paucivorans]|uniref:Uncharacterized protein n=1 Tax=Brevibacterium paucivorans TaxID=170994 RepID=A0ABS2SIZ1_9MICO|nr:hypothetical protein [Brevibacterium paucivorans]